MIETLTAAAQSPLSADLLARARARAGRGSVVQALIDLAGCAPEDKIGRAHV